MHQETKALGYDLSTNEEITRIFFYLDEGDDPTEFLAEIRRQHPLPREIFIQGGYAFVEIRKGGRNSESKRDTAKRSGRAK